ncbi:MAG: dihydrolipoyl dehydrogenase [bacterium]
MGGDENRTYHLWPRGDGERSKNYVGRRIINLNADCDVAIIGAGPGGYVAAIRAAQLGAKVALIEKDELGGTCLNRGCIPTKALLYAAEILDSIEKGERYGISVKDVAVDLPKLMARKDSVVRTLVGGIQSLMKSNGVQVVRGVGKLRSAKEVEVAGPGGKGEIISAKNIVIATGSVPADLPLAEFDGKGVISSDHALTLESVPESILIIGGGAIGLEFATVFARLGSKVTVVELLPQILPNEDADIASGLTKVLKKQRIDIFTDSSVENVKDGPKNRKVVEVATKDGKRSFEVEKVMVAVGRRPHLDGLNLDGVGVKIERGRIIADERMRTNVPGIYAIGDVVGKFMLAHSASHEGVVAVENALGGNSIMSYKAIPRCIYTLPEVAAVGLTEKEARDRGLDVKVGKFPLSANGKSLIMDEREGFVKIVADKRYGEVLGVHILGPHATDMIAEVGVLMNIEGIVEDLSHAIHPHPTVSEAIMEAALDAEDRAIHIPRRKL